MKLNMIVYFLHIIHIFPWGLDVSIISVISCFHLHFFNKGNLDSLGFPLDPRSAGALTASLLASGDFGAGCLRACVGSVPWWVQAPQIGNEKIYEHHWLFHVLYEPNTMILEDH